MRIIDENTITDVVIEQMSSTPNPRLKQIMEALVRHLHAFAREVDLTREEWREGIRFLTATGHACTEHRQEFILLSDVIGLSAVVDEMHDRRGTEASATRTSNIGPYFRPDAPAMKLGDSVVSRSGGSEIVMYGRVVDSAGRGIPDALVQTWEADETGNYDLQKFDPSVTDLRGNFRTDAEGRYYFRALCPLGYLIPMDGPVGDLIRAQKRHGYRPAHIHFRISAPRYRELVTALFITGDGHLDSDTVFGVRQSLIVPVNKKDANSPLPKLPSIRYDFALAAATAEDRTSRPNGAGSQQEARKAQ